MVGAALHCDQLISSSSGIYLIIHRASGKLYIGSALSLARRHGEHQRMLRRGAHENNHLQKAWNRHGPEAFTFTVLFHCAPADLLYYEQRALDCYKQSIGWRRMYNCNPTASSRLGSRMSAKNYAMLLARLKGNQYTKGRKLSPEHRAKLSVITTRRNLGRKLSDETKAKIGNANRGRVPSAETRAKISAAGKGRKLSDVHKAKLASSSRFSGRRHTEEAKLKISQSSKSRARRRDSAGKFEVEGAV